MKRFTAMAENGFCPMVECSDGEYVLYSDVVPEGMVDYKAEFETEKILHLSTQKLCAKLIAESEGLVYLPAPPVPDKVAECADKLRKLRGLAPYNHPSNLLYGDHYFSKSITRDYTSDEIKKAGAMIAAQEQSDEQNTGPTWAEQEDGYV